MSRTQGLAPLTGRLHDVLKTGKHVVLERGLRIDYDAPDAGVERLILSRKHGDKELTRGGMRKEADVVRDHLYQLRPDLKGKVKKRVVGFVPGINRFEVLLTWHKEQARLL